MTAPAPTHQPAAATTSRSAFERVSVLVPRSQSLAAVAAERPLTPFSEEALTFIERLSKGILTGGAFRTYPEMIAFAHWMRRRQILELKSDFERKRAGAHWQGRGIVLHFAPSNVDTIFLYSFLLSLAVGNPNIVRVSGKRGPQVSAVLALIDEILADPRHEAVRRRLAIITYEHDEAISGALSDLCDLRVVWGGDETVKAIRKLPLPPHARDLCFPDKWSISVFDAGAVLACEDIAGVARNYVNDTYWFAQMACSSPRMMVWRGTRETCRRAGERFWPAVEAAIGAIATEIAPIDIVNKHIAEDSVAMAQRVEIRKGASNLLNVVRLGDLAGVPVEDHCGAGLFFEAEVESLAPLRDLLGRKLQTIVSFGVAAQDWRDLLAGDASRGIDRIVPVGQALAFSSIWDGYDLMREFSREITVQAP